MTTHVELNERIFAEKTKENKIKIKMNETARKERTGKWK